MKSKNNNTIKKDKELEKLKKENVENGHNKKNESAYNYNQKRGYFHRIGW